MLSFFLLLPFLLSCSEQRAPHFTLNGFTMGTSYHVTVVADFPEEKQQQLQVLIDAQLEKINDTMSTYIDYSELSILNKLPANGWFEVGPELFDILLLSMEIHWLSNGAFDPTVGALVDLWGFGPTERNNEPPSDAEITALLQTVGFQNLELNLGTGEAFKKTQLSIDLSAIAKGYGVDKVAELLMAQNIKDFMVEIGGEVRTAGSSPRRSPWKIAIERPEQGAANVQEVVILGTAAIATSGDYRNYFEKDGKRYSHTLDPRTGYPITHKLSSVTVIADTAAYADALATAMTVMGAEEGMKLAAQQQLAVYMILKTEQGFAVKFSDAFTSYLD